MTRFATLLFLLAAASPAAAAVPTQARLVVPKAAETVLKATSSLPVNALPTARHEPVANGALLVEFDVTKLEKELDGARKRLTSAQAEKRRAVTESAIRGSARTGLQMGDVIRNAELAEASALSDLARMQALIATANLHAPADGYVIEQLYAVGAKAKRRKPLLLFAEAAKTVVEVAVPAAEAGPFASGVEVRIADAGSTKAFRGKVESATLAGDAGESVALRIRPLELPFLALDSVTPVTLTVAR